jgi:hypothetical protein
VTGTRGDRRVKLTTALERVAIGVASLALSIGLIALLSGFFAGRDQAGVSVSAPPIGQQFADQGDRLLQPGQPHPAFNSDPPTSGPHVAKSLTRDQVKLTDDQLLTALATGNIVITYPGHDPPKALVAFQRKIAGPFSAPLAASGEAVVLARRPGTIGLIGLAWAHMVRVSAADDPLLTEFTQYWLGRGSPGSAH